MSVATFAATPDSVLARVIRRFVLLLWRSPFRNDFGQLSSCFREHIVMVLSYGCRVQACGFAQGVLCDRVVVACNRQIVQQRSHRRMRLVPGTVLARVEMAGDFS